MIIYIKCHCIPQSADHLNDITIPHENIPKAIARHPQPQSRHYHMKIPKAIAPHPQSPTTECTSWMALMYHDQPGGLLAWGGHFAPKMLWWSSSLFDRHYGYDYQKQGHGYNQYLFYRSLNRQRYSNQNRPPIKITKPIQSTLYPFTHFIWKFYSNKCFQESV